MRHDRAHYNGDQDSSYDEEHAQVPNRWKCPIGKEYCAAAYPRTYQIAHENMPWFRLESRMEYAVHADCLVAQDGRHGRRAEDPSEKVPPAGEPAAYTPISASGYGRPVIDCAGVNRGIQRWESETHV